MTTTYVTAQFFCDFLRIDAVSMWCVIDEEGIAYQQDEGGGLLLNRRDVKRYLERLPHSFDTLQLIHEKSGTPIRVWANRRHDEEHVEARRNWLGDGIAYQTVGIL